MAARDLAYSLVKLLEWMGVTTLVTYELTQVAGVTSISEVGFSFIADAIIYIGFAEIESEVAKVISVLKLRGCQHQADLRRLLITDSGLKVGTKFTGLSGVLQGAPIGHYRETIDEILQPLTFISDFVDVLSDETLSSERRREGRPWLQQPVDVRDVAHGCICALESDAAIGEAFNISAPRAIPFDEAARIISEVTGKMVVKRRVPVRWVFDLDNTKAKAMIGYRPKFDIEQMVKSAIESGSQSSCPICDQT